MVVIRNSFVGYIPILVAFAKCWRRSLVLRGCGGGGSASYPSRRYRRQNTPAHSAFRRALFASVSQSRLVMDHRQEAYSFVKMAFALDWSEMFQEAGGILSDNIDF